MKNPNPIDKYVGNRVKIARVMAGMSQEKLGDALGITFQQVQKYEKGINRVSASKLQAIADAVGRPVSWFFDEGPADKKADTDIIGQMLSAPYGVDLAHAYVALKHNKDRHTVFEIAARFAAIDARVPA